MRVEKGLIFLFSDLSEETDFFCSEMSQVNDKVSKANIQFLRFPLSYCKRSMSSGPHLAAS